MPVTVGALARRPGLQLHVRAAATAVDRVIAWVHVSELADPTPFLAGGELLLTTGMGSGTTPAEQAAYVERLASADAAGLGFGTGLTWDAVPEQIVAAAERVVLPVLEVPRQTPFIAISKAVLQALAADDYAEVTRTNAAQKAFTAAAVRGDGFGALLRQLHVELGTWALLLDPSGAVRRADPPSAASRIVTLESELERLRVGKAASAAFVANGSIVTIQSLGARGRVRGFLAVGRTEPLTTADRHILNSAASLLTLTLERSRSLEAAQQQLRAAMFDLLLADQAQLVRRLARHLGADLPEVPLRVVAVAGPAELRRTASDLLEIEAERTATPVFDTDVDGLLIVVVGDRGTFPGWLVELPPRLDGLRVGVSEQAEFSELAGAYRQARQAVESAMRNGVSVTHFGELAGESLLRLVEPDRVRAFAAAALGPLLRHDAAGRGDLVTSLRVWLEYHGQFDPASARLGIHRHTLRHRIRRVEQLLGRSLDSPGVRAELWLALQVEPKTSATVEFPT